MKKKVMVVDDEPDQLITVKAILEDVSDEYEVITVDSGIKCIEHLENNNIPDLIILDILMPEMNGWEVHKRIKRELEWRNIPIIFLTATQDKTSEITGNVIGEEFIEKPFDSKYFVDRINRILK
jgi:CheY-like chemotaxis protein